MTWPAGPGIAALAAVVLAACATPGYPGAEPVPEPGVAPRAVEPASASAPAPRAAEGELIGQGTVLQVGDTLPRFCLGGVMESYPPQCSGPLIDNWDWALAAQSETASGVTWGAYAVTGTWDGTVFTMTGAPVPLSLYDALPFEDPRLPEGRRGPANRQELERIQQELFSGAGDDLPLSGVPGDGYLTVTVVYDDGSLQTRMDAEYGVGVVVVLSALRPLT
ncbi:hypothetical protein [Arthrobacter sedimenti]|uniref:hypothetical protein n=1 Tax=Arthrobacter sedimenti TaxID=2694931 RepID=UPI000B35FBEC|nr:hypothetical protein [Arthrobacter sedimenti]OUM44953.1 hypothetical protein B8W73_02200 [Arthrobacter agilis]